MQKAWLLLGSNEGQREDWLEKGTAALETQCSEIVALSHIYITAAWGIEDQPDFLNRALCIATELTPEELLGLIQEIEQLLGRQRTLKWGQRTLDIDILFYEDKVIDTPELKIPHPYLQLRRFALAPLNDIAANLVHPVLHQTISQLLEACPDPLPATRLF